MINFFRLKYVSIFAFKSSQFHLATAQTHFIGSNRLATGVCLEPKEHKWGSYFIGKTLNSLLQNPNTNTHPWRSLR